MFLILALIIVRTVIDILALILEHMIDNPGDLARGDNNRFGRAVLGAHLYDTRLVWQGSG